MWVNQTILKLTYDPTPTFFSLGGFKTLVPIRFEGRKIFPSQFWLYRLVYAFLAQIRDFWAFSCFDSLSPYLLEFFSHLLRDSLPYSWQLKAPLTFYSYYWNFGFSARRRKNELSSIKQVQNDFWLFSWFEAGKW